MPIVTVNDWIPRYFDYGLDKIIEEIAPNSYESMLFINELNGKITLPPITWKMFLQFYSDMRDIGKLNDIIVEGDVIPPSTRRYDAPSGLGQSQTEIWFSEPNRGKKTIRWYVNGIAKVTTEYNCETNRTIAKSVLGCITGDIVQVAVIENGICGWWSRITVE